LSTPKRRRCRDCSGGSDLPMSGVDPSAADTGKF
jgi:hypothetical protein